MAKSLRSKVKRKHRAIKRKRWAVKELAALKKVVANDKVALDDADVKELVTVKDPATIPASNSEAMDTDQTNTSAKKYNSKTWRDEDGNRPPWFNKSKKRKLLSKKVKKGKKKVGWRTKHEYEGY